jgi:HSP20 family protein
MPESKLPCAMLTARCPSGAGVAAKCRTPAAGKLVAGVHHSAARCRIAKAAAGTDPAPGSPWWRLSRFAPVETAGSQGIGKGPGRTEATMAKTLIELKKTDSILNELDQLHDAISRRAYDLFRHHEGLPTDPLDDWLCAERDLVWRPAVALREKDGQIELLAALAGVNAADLDVRVTPEEILITGKTEHHHEARHGTVHLCEFAPGRLFRTVHLPERIDPDSAKAELRNGMLHMTAAVATAETQKIDVHAA